MYNSYFDVLALCYKHLRQRHFGTFLILLFFTILAKYDLFIIILPIFLFLARTICTSLSTSHLLLGSFDPLSIPLSHKSYLKMLLRFEKALPNVGTIYPKLYFFDLWVK